ncbi:packaged DNA stabilization gp4 family protein [Acinetobacter sp. ABJ_C1_1]|uniref:packaged DNA stabilization gp4 family protein n=1 Tax=Acinetobacter sp. ABJ_C1_1 TaxID=3378321 RepID=UPI0037DCADEE
MSWTKRQIIEQAYEELGLAAMFFDLQPEQIESARRKMDSMVAGWSTKNIQVGYPLPSEANSSDVDQETNVPDYAVEALYLNLAIKIAPSHGKAVSPETKIAAKAAFNTILQKAVSNPPKMNYSCELPSGAGNKSCDPFIRQHLDNDVLTPDQSAGFFNE